MATSEPFDMAKEPFKIVPLTHDGLEIYKRPRFKLEFIEDLQFNPNLGQELIDQSQKMTAAAMQIAEK